MTYSVVALATFCGDHGARIIFCTRSTNSFSTSLNVGESCNNSNNKNSNNVFKKSSHCQACRSLPSGTRHIKSKRTKNPQDSGTYVSGNLEHVVESTLDAERLLKAAERTFYVEATCDKKSKEVKGHQASEVGAQLFCDSASSSSSSRAVLAQKFSLKDHLDVRGFKRNMCVLAVHEDPPYLARNMDRLGGYFAQLIASLQHLAERNFDGKHRASVDKFRHSVIRESLRNMAEFTHENVYSLVHAKFCQILHLLGCGAGQRRWLEDYSGREFVKDPKKEGSDSSASPVSRLRALAGFLSPALFSKLLCNVASGVPTVVVSSSREVLAETLDSLQSILPRRRSHNIWRRNYSWLGFLNGFREWAPGHELDGHKLKWFESHVLGAEQLVVCGGVRLEGAEYLSGKIEDRGSNKPNLVKSVSRLIYAPAVDSEVVRTFVDASVEKYMSWAKVWMECKRNPELCATTMLRKFNLKKCEEPILSYWCLLRKDGGQH